MAYILSRTKKGHRTNSATTYPSLHSFLPLFIGHLTKMGLRTTEVRHYILHSRSCHPTNNDRVKTLNQSSNQFI